MECTNHHVGNRQSQTKWRLNRIDIHSPVSPHALPVARVEVEHHERGRLTDIGSAPGILGSAFRALSNVMNINARVVALSARSEIVAVEDSCSTLEAAFVDISLIVDEREYSKSAVGVDIFSTCLEAFLEAASAAKGSEAHRAPCSPSRPHRVVGIDENQDLWIFASEDRGAAEAIAAEFTGDAYTHVQLVRSGGADQAGHIPEANSLSRLNTGQAQKSAA